MTWYDELDASIAADQALISWLRAQLDEDERGARDAGGGGWVAVGLAFVDDTEGHQMVRDESMGSGVQAHIARHDPASVLAEVAAKRRLLDEVAGEMAGDPTVQMERLRLRHLALPYADQPGYRDEWRPTTGPWPVGR